MKAKKVMMVMAVVTAALAAEVPVEAYDSADVAALFGNMLMDISGDDSVAKDDTSKYTRAALEKVDAWYVEITDQYVALETLDDTYYCDVKNDDGMLILAKGIAYKYVFDDFVDEEIMLLVDRSDIGEFTVDDDNFEDYVDQVEEEGYGPIKGDDADDFVKALKEALADDSSDASEDKEDDEKKGSDAGSFQNGSFFRNDYAVTYDDLQKD